MKEFVIKYKYAILALILLVAFLFFKKANIKDVIYQGYVPFDTLALVKLKYQKQLDSLKQIIYFTEGKVNNTSYKPIYIKKYEKAKTIIEMVNGSTSDDDIKYFQDYFSKSN